MHYFYNADPGDRIPTIWVFPNDTKIRVRNHHNEDGNHGVDLPKNSEEWTNLKIQQLQRSNGTYEYIVEMNGEEIFSGINHSAREWTDVKVYHSTKMSNAASYLIRNLQFESKPELSVN